MIYEFEEEMEFDPADYAEEIAAARLRAGLPVEAPAPAVKVEDCLFAPPARQKFCGYDLPEGVDLSCVDIENPPDLAGKIVDLMRGGAYRRIYGGAYSLMALQVMAACAGKLRGYSRSKLSLVTITLGVSAAGKEHPQEVAKSLLDDVGVIASGDIRSDKDVLRTVVAHDARCIYIIDEAQKLLINSQQQEDNAKKNVQNTLMELITSNNFKLSEMHKNEFSEKYQNQLAKLDKKLLAKDDMLTLCNPAYDGEKMAHLQAAKDEILKEIEAVKSKINVINIGIRDAALNFAAFSTPAKLADFIDEAAIESGFLGRGLIADCGVDAERLNRELLGDQGGAIFARLAAMKSEITEDLKAIYDLSLDDSDARVAARFAGGDLFKADEEAAELIRKIGFFYDDLDEYRNHPRLGALFRRIFERLCSVSSILALDSVKQHGVAILKKEHVLYAIAIILKSIAMLESNLKINEGATSQRMEDKMKALEAAIIKSLSEKEFKYKSKIKDSIKRRAFFTPIEKIALAAGQDAIDTAFMQLESKGIMMHSGCGKKIKLT